MGRARRGIITGFLGFKLSFKIDPYDVRFKFFSLFFLFKLNKALLIKSYKATRENLFTTIYYAVMEADKVRIIVEKL